MVTTEYNESKFKELVLYLAQRFEADATFGAVKLNKMLFFADNLAYAHYGAPITGVEYVKMERGPGPGAMRSVRESMEESGDIKVVQREYPGSSYRQIRIVPQREPDLTMFTGTEIALVDRIAEFAKGATASALSELTHTMMGWRIAEMGEPIPYSAIFLSNAPTTESDRRRTRELAEEHGW